MIYVRWRRGESRRGRVFPSPTPGDGTHGTTCVACGSGLYGDGGEIQLVAVGPVDDDEVEQYAAGRWFKAGAVAVHRSDVDTMSDADLDALCAELVVVSDDDQPPVTG